MLIYKHTIGTFRGWGEKNPKSQLGDEGEVGTKHKSFPAILQYVYV